MDRKLKAARIKKVVEQQTQIRVKSAPHLLHVAEFEAGELYEGVTDDAPVSDSAQQKMVTRGDDVVNSQGS